MIGYKIKLTIALFLFIVGAGRLYALNQNDLKIISKGEDIRYLSQKIANDYLYYFNTPQKKEYLDRIKIFIEKIENDLRFMAKSTNNDDIKNILDFLSYGKDQIKDILEKEISRDKVSRILEYCDTLVEGVESILKERGYHTVTGDMRYYIMKLSKLYMAVHLKFEPSENTKLLYETKGDIESIIKKQNTFLSDLWFSYKDMINPNPIYFIPNILSVMIWDLERNAG